MKSMSKKNMNIILECLRRDDEAHTAAEAWAVCYSGTLTIDDH